jgi:hypothetical protein
MTDRARIIGTVFLVALLIWSKSGGGVGPQPSVAPIPEPGLHVLAISETMSVTPQLAAVLNSAAWQQIVPQGNWRVFDPDADMSKDAPKWQAAMQRPRTALPWVIISNHPYGGYEGPLPKTLPELVTLIKKVEAQR